MPQPAAAVTPGQPASRTGDVRSPDRGRLQWNKVYRLSRPVRGRKCRRSRPVMRYEDLVEAFTVLSGTLAEDESVHDTLQSILALALKLVPGCSAASVTVLDEQGQPGTIADHR